MTHTNTSSNEKRRVEANLSYRYDNATDGDMVYYCLKEPSFNNNGNFDHTDAYRSYKDDLQLVSNKSNQFKRTFGEYCRVAQYGEYNETRLNVTDVDAQRELGTRQQQIYPWVRDELTLDDNGFVDYESFFEYVRSRDDLETGIGNYKKSTYGLVASYVTVSVPIEDHPHYQDGGLMEERTQNRPYTADPDTFAQHVLGGRTPKDRRIATEQPTNDCEPKYGPPQKPVPEPLQDVISRGDLSLPTNPQDAMVLGWELREDYSSFLQSNKILDNENDSTNSKA